MANKIEYIGEAYYDGDGCMVRERVGGVIEILSSPRIDIFFDKLQNECIKYKNKKDKQIEDRKVKHTMYMRKYRTK
jgi:hypothetical protein